MPKKLNSKQELLIGMLEDSLTKTEFLSATKKLINYVKQIKENNISELDKMSKALTEASKNAKNNTSSDFNALKGELSKLVNLAISKTNDTLDNKINEVDLKVMNIKNGKDGKDIDEKKVIKKMLKKIRIPDIKKINKDLPKFGIEIRDGLELLKNDERLEISAIKDLEKRLDKIEKTKGSVTVVGGGGGGGRIVKAHDLSASLDGVTKTFTLPAFWRVISVHASSFPNALRPEIDYTVDVATPSITFTSEITAGATLASGQTILLTYSE